MACPGMGDVPAERCLLSLPHRGAPELGDIIAIVAGHAVSLRIVLAGRPALKSVRARRSSDLASGNVHRPKADLGRLAEVDHATWWAKPDAAGSEALRPGEMVDNWFMQS
jgi:hypothetical protein